MKIEVSDFIKIDFDVYANEKLVETTNEKTGKSEGLQNKTYGTQSIIVGANMILKKVEDSIIEGKNEAELNLKPKDAYGIKNKENIKTIPKKFFDDNKLRVVVGMVYDFSGMFGIVKSVSSNRVLVDFNNPLASKDIKFKYKIVSKIDDLKEKVELIFDKMLRIPNNMFDLKVDKKKVEISFVEPLKQLEKQIEDQIKMYIFDIDLKLNFDKKIKK